MEDRINIQEYLAMIRSRKRIILAIILLSLVLGGFRMYKNYVSYVPKYTSTVTVKIDTMKVQKEEAAKEREKSGKSGSKNSDKSSDGDLDDSKKDSQVDNSYNNLFNYSTIAQDEAIASRYYSYATDSAVYNNVAQVAGVRSSKVESISAVQNEDRPEEIKITVTSSDAKSAQLIANAIPEVYGELLLKEIGIDCVSVVYDASNGTIIPRKIDTSIFVFGLIGIAAAIFIVLLLEILNTKIITPDDIEKYWELPLLGVVPEFDDVPYKMGDRRRYSHVKESNLERKVDILREERKSAFNEKDQILKEERRSAFNEKNQILREERKSEFNEKNQNVDYTQKGESSVRNTNDIKANMEEYENIPHTEKSQMRLDVDNL